MLGVGALIFSDDRILLVERGGEPLKGWWSLPGGALETGETIVDGVRREVREETALDVRPLRLFEVFERIMRDENGTAEYHYVLLDYICEVVSGSPIAGDDVSALAWASKQQLAEYRLTEGTLDVIERAFSSR